MATFSANGGLQVHINRSKDYVHSENFMVWTEDPQLWVELDDLLLNAWPDVKDFLDVLVEHRTEFHPTVNTVIFNGCGNFVKSYVEARHEANPPNLALAVALEKVTQNPNITRLMQSQMNAAVDNMVKGMDE